MRLSNDSRGRGRVSDAGAALDRVENILVAAADFDPGIEPLGDFVRTALSRPPRRRRKQARPFVLGFSSLASGVAAAALLLFVMSRYDGGRETIGVGSAVPVVNVPEVERQPSSQSSNAEGASVAKTDAGTGVAGAVRDAQNTQAARKDVGEKDNSPITRRHSGIESASIQEPRAAERHESKPRIPKVRWQDEVVQRYDRGVYAPAYMVEEKDRNGDVVYQPVMMPVTTETGARPILLDGAADTSIQWTSQSEETSHK